MPYQAIINGGFESGALEPGWRPVPGTAQFDGGVTSAQAHSGNYSLELRGLDYVEQRYSGHFTACGDLTFWLKCPSFPNNGPLYLTAEYSDESYDSVLLTEYASDSWREVTVAISHLKHLIGIRFSSGETNPYYIDDISLQVLWDRIPMPDFPQVELPAPVRPLFPPFVCPNYPQSVYLPPSYFYTAQAQSLENRLVHIENTLNQLLQFIKREMRPKASRAGRKKES